LQAAKKHEHKYERNRKIINRQLLQVLPKSVNGVKPCSQLA